MGTVDLFTLIGRVETANDSHQLRFEPTVFAKVNTPGTYSDRAHAIVALIQKANACSLGTARMIFSTSWGEVQMMGFNIYGACGFKGRVVDFLTDPLQADGRREVQVSAFHAFLKSEGLADCTPEVLAGNAPLRLHFAIKYNGSIDYVKPLIAALRHFGFNVQ